MALLLNISEMVRSVSRSITRHKVGSHVRPFSALGAGALARAGGCVGSAQGEFGVSIPTAVLPVTLIAEVQPVSLQQGFL